MSYSVQSYTQQQYCDVHVATRPSATPIDKMCSTQNVPRSRKMPDEKIIC